MNDNIVLVWAWGTGMSWVAQLLSELWFSDNIICIDSTQSELTDKLEESWIKVVIWHNQYQVQKSDNIIYSTATEKSPEVQTALGFSRDPKEQRLIVSYPEFIWEISKHFQTIAISGTNWKSTSTSLAIYSAKNLFPNFGLGIVWALVPDLSNKSYWINYDIVWDLQNIFNFIFTWRNLDKELVNKYLFFVEACEYQRHFLHYDIDYTMITNIELDHTDYYKDYQDYLSAFQSLVDRTKKKIISLSDYSIKTDKMLIAKPESFEFTYIFGDHNQKNASLLLTLFQEIDTTQTTEKIKAIMKKFRWIWRRLEFLANTRQWTLVFSDYWHVASSIKVWYNALKWKYPNKKLTVVFQPHQINRIVQWWEDFPDVFSDYDEVFIYDIYAARENISVVQKLWLENISTIKDLGKIFAKHCGGKYITNIEEVMKIINSKGKDDIVICFTAGDLDYKLRNVIEY